MSSYCEKILKSNKTIGESLLNYYYQYSGAFVMAVGQIESCLSRALANHARLVFRKLDQNLKVLSGHDPWA